VTRPRAVTAAVLGDAFRRLEERGEWTTVGELAREMEQRRPARLLEVLDLAWFLDVDGRSVFDGVLVIEKCDGDRDLPPAQTRIWINRGSDPDGPLRGTGLALVGAGAYTLDEIAERLDVIAEAGCVAVTPRVRMPPASDSRRIRPLPRRRRSGGYRD
jgi:hypothetical protein